MGSILKLLSSFRLEVLIHNISPGFSPIFGFIVQNYT